MLERTAGCLESGSLRRLIPGSKTAANRRMLHSGFWSHGTAELEMSPLWQALVQVSEARDTAATGAPRNSSAMAAGAFLDFLYPTGALSPLHQCTPWAGNVLDRRRARATHSPLGQRSYSGTASDTGLKDERSEVVQKKAIDQLDDVDDIEREFGVEAEHDIEILPRIEKQPQVGSANTEALVRVLHDERTNDYEEVWRQFRLLNSESQLSMAVPVFDYLSTSDRLPDARRMIQLFKDFRDTASEDRFRIFLRAHLILGDFEGVLDEHLDGLEKYGKLMESGRIMAALISNNQWDLTYEIWGTVKSFTETHPEHNSYEFQQWSYLQEVPDIAERAINIRNYFKTLINKERPDAMNVFLGRILYAALFPKDAVDWKQFVVIFRLWRGLRLDVKHFQRNSARAISKLLSMHQQKLAVFLYKSVRDSKHLYFSPPLLVRILDVFCKYGDAAGQDMVLADWTTLFDRPTSQLLRKCISARAYRGDVKRIQHLFTTLLERGIGTEDGIRNADDLNPLLVAHARRGEVSACEAIFEQIHDVYGFKPTDKNRNILLNAYGKSNFLDEAYKLYTSMVAEKNSVSKPHDGYTVGTMMGIFTQQGDFNGVNDVYDAAVDSGTKVTTAMLDCIVYSHIQRNELKKAEQLCMQATTRIVDEPPTRMWNYLLVAYAMRRDLDNLQRVHRKMDSKNVPFDGHTYAALLLALAVGGQPGRGKQIMMEVMPQAGVKVTGFHYAIVMGGFIRTEEYDNVLRLHQEMLQDSDLYTRDTAASTRMQVMKATAMLDQKYLDEGSTEDQFKMADQYFFETLNSGPDDVASTARKGIKGSEALDIAQLYSKFDFYIFLAGHSRAFVKVQELTQQFLSLAPAERKKAIPLKLYSSLMIAQYKEGDHQAVEDTWNMAYDIAKYQARDIKGGRLVLYNRRFDLSRLLSTLIQSYRDTNKMAQLKAIVRQVTDAGFELDSKNWNLYIQALTRTHAYSEAFEQCEIKLMPGWLGWQKVRAKLPVRNRLDIATRRLKENPTYFRPVFHTLLFLAKAYIEMDAAAEMGGDYGHRLKMLEDKAPRTLHAIRTMQREGDDLERIVLSDE